MTKEEFKKQIIGKRIINITFSKDWQNKETDEILVNYIELEDGERINFSGSYQIGVDEVYAELI